jgi:YD repeat-containing protein
MRVDEDCLRPADERTKISSLMLHCINARSRFRYGPGLVLGVVAFLASQGIAMGQTLITTPPPIRSTVDANGVDLVTGALTITSPGLSIGQGEGALTYQRNIIATGWTDNVIGTVNVSGSTTTISFGAISDSFTLSGGVYTNAEGLGSTLTLSGGYYTYTSGAGVVTVFQQSLAGYIPSYGNGGRPISVTYPDGRVLTYTYQTVTVSGQSASRVQSVNNNFGYQLKFTYALNTPATLSDLTAWTTVATVTGINNAVDYCSPSANSCSGFSQSWPTLTYLTVTGPPQILKVTDSLSNVTQYLFNDSGLLSGVMLPGASAFNTAIVYNTSSQVISINNSAKKVGPTGAASGIWTYSYSASGGTGTVLATDPLGHLRTVVSNLTTSLPTSDTDALGRMVSYLYDSYGRLTQVTLPESNYTVYAHDARGNVTTTTAYPNNGPGHGSIQTSANYDTTCAQPAKCNQPNYTIDANGNQTTYTYDATHGTVLTVTGPPPTSGAVAPQTTLSYTQLYAWYKNSAGTIVQAATPIDLLTGVSGCATTASCSGTADQVVSSITYGTPGVANNLGATSASAGAGVGSPLTTSSVTYDVFGNVATSVGPLGSAQTTAYFYDADRQPTGVIGPEPAGATTYPALRYTFSANGQPTLIEQGDDDQPDEPLHVQLAAAAGDRLRRVRPAGADQPRQRGRDPDPGPVHLRQRQQPHLHGAAHESVGVRLAAGVGLRARSPGIERTRSHHPEHL